jgi:uncharacterized membrane protein
MPVRDVPSAPVAREGRNRPPEGAERVRARRWVTATNRLTEAVQRARGRTGVRGVRVAQAFTIDRNPHELYQRWRNLEDLPRLLSHLDSVRELDARRSRWVAEAPAIAGGRVTWEAEITADVPGERIAWRSLPGSEIENEGSVSFERTRRGTVVRVELRYVAPAGPLGRLVAKLFGGSPEAQVREDLRSFKRLMETGEVLTTQGQSHGTCTKPAQRGGRR